MRGPLSLLLPHRQYSDLNANQREAPFRTVVLAIVLGSVANLHSSALADDSTDADDPQLETVVVSPAISNDGTLSLTTPEQLTSPEQTDETESAETDIAETDTIENESISTETADGPDLRVAKRPWLLEKLVGPEKVESIKMDAPSPPLDPPSMGHISPPPSQDGWISRRRIPPVALGANPSAKRVPRDTKTDSSYRRSGLRPTASVPQLRRLQVEESLPIESASQKEMRQAKTAKPKNIKLIESPLRDTKIDQRISSLPMRELDLSGQTSDRSPTDTSDNEGSIAAVDPGSVEDAETPQGQPTIEPSYVGDDIDSTETAIDRDYAGFPSEPIDLTRSAYQMRSKMHRCLRYYHSDMEIATGRSNWGMMHAMMVYGIDTKVIVGRRNYSTIAWVAGNNVCRGQRLFTEDENGKIVAKNGVGLQGHDGQLLAIFSLCNVPSDYPLYAGNKKFSVQDVIESEMLACKSGEELTFILIALSKYLDTDQQWLSAEAETWDMERLIREELRQPIVGAACGGTHRLMGFAHALRQRRIDGKPIDGQWKRAETFTEDFVQYAYRLQNRDGSMSTDWFEGREDNGNLDRKVQTTGHMVEWLLTVTPDSQLQNPRLLSAVAFLLKSMDQGRDRDWSIGPKGHALRSLAMFYDRVYQSPPPWRNNGMASKSRSRRTHSRRR